MAFAGTDAAGVFDRAQIARQRDRAARLLPAHDFLFRWAASQIEDRLSIIRRRFPVCVHIGARGPALPPGQFGIDFQVVMDSATRIPSGPAVRAEEDFFPFANQSIDLAISNLNLHTVNDLPGALLQVRRALRPDGLFLAALLGGETLRELRKSIADAELELTGRAAPRVAPFIDKPQMGALLQRAGFALPVVDSDIVTVTYDSLFPLMADLRGMGEQNAVAARSRRFAPRRLFMRAAELSAEQFAEAGGRIAASFEVIFAIGWAPHASQQQPLRPGSAEHRLADTLGSLEQPAGERTR